jgi:hypothetical protein
MINRALGWMYRLHYRRRADEVIEQRHSLPQRRMSAFGTKRTSGHSQSMSAFGGKADIVVELLRAMKP